ncbi:MAG: hypothetical protein WC876_11255 [Candidatus Thermoplasmatota archaeon]|jgi:hypothetical protein
MTLSLRGLVDAAKSPGWHGFGSIHLVTETPFWDEADLPFELFGGGAVVRLDPAQGFTKTSLAASHDELLLVLDCPDAPGWLVPTAIVADWMARNVVCAALDDVLLSNPLYSYATRVDRQGRSRIGATRLAQWAPGLPTVASLMAPEWLPRDADAPRVNRDRATHVAALQDLVQALDSEFGLLEVEVGSRFGPPRGSQASLGGTAMA